MAPHCAIGKPPDCLGVIFGSCTCMLEGVDFRPACWASMLSPMLPSMLSPILPRGRARTHAHACARARTHTHPDMRVAELRRSGVRTINKHWKNLGSDTPAQLIEQIKLSVIGFEEQQHEPSYGVLELGSRWSIIQVQNHTQLTSMAIASPLVAHSTTRPQLVHNSCTASVRRKRRRSATASC